MNPEQAAGLARAIIRRDESDLPSVSSKPLQQGECAQCYTWRAHYETERDGHSDALYDLNKVNVANDDLSKEIVALQKIIDVRNDEAVASKLSLDAERERASNLQANVHSLQGELEKQKEQVEHREKMLEKARDDIKKFREEGIAKQQEILALRTQLDEEQRTCTNQKTEIARLKGNQRTYMEWSGQSEEQIEQLKKDLKGFQSQVLQKDTELQEMQKNSKEALEELASRHLTQLQERISRIEELEGDLRGKDEAVKSLQAQLAAKDSSIQTLQRDLSGAQALLIIYEKQKTEWELRIASHREGLTSFRDAVGQAFASFQQDFSKRVELVGRQFPGLFEVSLLSFSQCLGAFPALLLCIRY
jgi:chromosome segregation ATPase